MFTLWFGGGGKLPFQAKYSEGKIVFLAPWCLSNICDCFWYFFKLAYTLPDFRGRALSSRPQCVPCSQYSERSRLTSALFIDRISLNLGSYFKCKRPLGVVCLYRALTLCFSALKCVESEVVCKRLESVMATLTANYRSY